MIYLVQREGGRGRETIYRLYLSGNFGCIVFSGYSVRKLISLRCHDWFFIASFWRPGTKCLYTSNLSFHNKKPSEVTAGRFCCRHSDAVFHWLFLPSFSCCLSLVPVEVGDIYIPLCKNTHNADVLYISYIMSSSCTIRRLQLCKNWQSWVWWGDTHRGW